MSPNPYPVPPPSYADPINKSSDQQPLLSPSSPIKNQNHSSWSRHQTSRNSAWNNEAQESGMSDDLFIGVTVSQATIEIRMAFIRKV